MVTSDAVQEQRAPLRIALYNGIVVERDAVSASFLSKLRLLQRLRDAGHPVEVTGFTQASDFPDADIRVVPNISGLARSVEFSHADVHVFEYGMTYDLFNAVFLIEKPSLVMDHNTTPPELIGNPVVKVACERAILERHNLHLATRIAANSEFTRSQLREMGFDDPITVLHPPGNTLIARSYRDLSDRNLGEQIRLLFVGRFVAAKGIADLMTALESLWQTDPDITATIAGSLRFAESDVVLMIERVLEKHRAHGRITFVPDADDERIADLYRSSDVFVVPSHHEGYCIPVIEALCTGCYVVGSDAGNVPNVMGGLGSVFATGDAAGLAEAIRSFASRVRESRRSGSELVLPTSSKNMPLSDWRSAVTNHVERYSLPQFEKKFLELLAELATCAHHQSSWILAAANELRPDVLPSAS